MSYVLTDVVLHGPIGPLREGRRSLREQADARGEPVPIGASVSRLIEMGYDVDSEWPPYATVAEDSDSPTGYVVRWLLEQTQVWALAT